MQVRDSYFLFQAILLITLFITCIAVVAFGQQHTTLLKVDRISGNPDTITIYPVQHASLVITTGSRTVYVDPVGGGALYAAYPKPDLILVTHTHSDHFEPDTINAVKGDHATIVGTTAAKQQLPVIQTMQNGEKAVHAGIGIEAIAAYNLTPERLKFHPKGQGNGYILTIDHKRIYISGDSEDTPEMRSLKNIDIAFVCMNLPYTMDEEQAASAVLAFKPAIVYPYHYRGRRDGETVFHDIHKFKKLVSADPAIDVRFLKWY